MARRSRRHSTNRKNINRGRVSYHPFTRRSLHSRFTYSAPRSLQVLNDNPRRFRSLAQRANRRLKLNDTVRRHKKLTRQVFPDPFVDHTKDLYKLRVCRSRKSRREVLHAKRLTGFGSRRSPVYKPQSKVRC